MMRLGFVWTEVKEGKILRTNPKVYKKKVKAKGFKTEVFSQSRNS